MRLSNREVRELREIYPHMGPVLDEAEVVEVVPLSGDSSISHRRRASIFENVG